MCKCEIDHRAYNAGTESYKESIGRFNEAIDEVSRVASVFANWCPGTTDVFLKVSREIHQGWVANSEGYSRVKDIFKKFGFTVFGYDFGDSSTVDEKKRVMQLAFANMWRSRQRIA